ncbi:rhodanese-like domain-containing protein [Flavobacterium sp. UMI-01]|uniref:rhodanese-like domain-containing protein n=1 Tax=Flavobacterium sp. UMI-01 TaxID=1441053 RepID=UPI001C7DA17A|nr:rhodanese-like domain-containing protein [Flavobacterium sp. UMI-01]GIZ10316.1 hypothetical protein FUMI01_30400 [Flavobacterium sp. UMI-01]
MTLRPLIYFLLLLLTISCNHQQTPVYQVVDATTFAQNIETTTSPQIIDVRTPEEYNQEHLVNAKNIDWNGNNFDNEVAKLDKTAPVFVYCKSGGRSQKAAAKLTELGFEKVYELEGGFMQWNAEGLKSNKN